MTSDNADMIRAAQNAHKPHPHWWDFSAAKCIACGRTQLEVLDKGIACDALVNHKPKVAPSW